MNSDKLSARLDAVARFVPAGSRLADIGSDHAYLPCYLAKKKLISSAIAGEVAKGPFESASREVAAEGLTDVISARLGDGLEVVQPGEADCIVIAGMGGELIASILQAGREMLDSVVRLVLQPNSRTVFVRKWLLENGWELIDEEILEEDRKIYEILAAEKGNPLKPYSSELDRGLLLGPILIQKQPDAFRKKWSLKMRTWQRIIEQLEKAPQTEENLGKKRELLKLLEMVRGVLQQ